MRRHGGGRAEVETRVKVARIVWVRLWSDLLFFPPFCPTVLKPNLSKKIFLLAMNFLSYIKIIITGTSP